MRDLLLRAKSLFGAAILWPSLNPAAPRDDKRVIAMTNEAGRTAAAIVFILALAAIGYLSAPEYF